MRSIFGVLEALQLFYYNNNNSWASVTNNSPAAGLGTNSASSNPSSAGNFCPTGANSMFGNTDVQNALNAIYNLFPNGTLECLAVTDDGSGVVKYWSVYFTVPPDSGSGWNKWCMDNYKYTVNGDLQGNWNGSANRQLRGFGGFLVTTCGENTDSPPVVTPYASPNW